VTESPNASIGYFTLTLPVASSSPVTVRYIIRDGTAQGATNAEIASGARSMADADYIVDAREGTVTFNPGETSKVVPVRVVADFVNESAETLTMQLTQVTNAGIDPTAATATATINNLLVRNLEFGGERVGFVDNSGNLVTLDLRGPGRASVQLRGTALSDGVRITLTGTTAQSQLIIRTNRGQTNIAEIVADGSLGGITGTTTNLTGNLTVGGGLVNLKLNSVSPVNQVVIPGVPVVVPNSQIVIGASSLGLNAVIGRASDLTITSGSPIRSLRFASLNDMDGAATTLNQISAPSIGVLSSSGNFTGIVRTSDLRTLEVGGVLQSSEVRAVLSIGSVTARSIVNTGIYAGMASTFSGLPTLASDFTVGSLIRSVTVRNGGVFSNSHIAAGNVGTLNLGTVGAANGGTPFGVAGLVVTSVRGRVGNSVFAVPRNQTDTGVFTPGDQDFKVAIFGPVA
jgi:hypothetical protein